MEKSAEARQAADGWSACRAGRQEKRFVGCGGLRRAVAGLLLLAGLSSMAGHAEDNRAELLIYCATTLILPMTEIARIVEKEQKVRITISQGASEDLYQSLRKSRLGDLYLPAEPDYRTRHLAEGLLGEHVTVGYNQVALLVRKGNPKKVKADLKELLRADLNVAIGSPERGAVGLETRRILQQAGLFDKVMQASAALGSDSRNLNQMLKRGEADLVVNFRATAYFPDNEAHIEALDLDPRISQPKPLWLSLTTVAKNPGAARRFMQYAAGPEGQAILKKYGFLVNATPLRP